MTIEEYYSHLPTFVYTYMNLNAIIYFILNDSCNNGSHFISNTLNINSYITVSLLTYCILTNITMTHYIFFFQLSNRKLAMR